MLHLIVRAPPGKSDEIMLPTLQVLATFSKTERYLPYCLIKVAKSDVNSDRFLEK